MPTRAYIRQSAATFKASRAHKNGKPAYDLNRTAPRAPQRQHTFRWSPLLESFSMSALDAQRATREQSYSAARSTCAFP